MRRVALFLLVALVVAACTSEGTVDSTAYTPATPVAPSTRETPATAPVAEPPVASVVPCRDVEPDLAAYMAVLGIGNLDLQPLPGTGPFSDFLPDQSAFADELGLDCSEVFYGFSDFGEMAHAVVAWDDDRILAAVGAFVKTGLLVADDGRVRVDLDGPGATTLHAAGEDVLWGDVHEWWAADTLHGIVAIAGDDPMAALGAWHRARGAGRDFPLVSMSWFDGWGGSGPSYTLYADGLLLSEVSRGRAPMTFTNAFAAYELSPGDVEALEVEALATGIVDGESFALPDGGGLVDFGSLWFEFRSADVTYYGSVYAPGPDEVTPSRQRVVDLAHHLEQIVAASQSTQWVPDVFVVRVVPYTAAGEGVTWTGSFDLSSGAERVCSVLQGDEAQDYLRDLASLGDANRLGEAAVFAYGDKQYSMTAIALLPGDIESQYARLSECRTSDSRQADPVLGLWLWAARGISDYEITVEVDCAQCDDVVTLDGETPVAIPGWGEIAAVEDLFALAGHDEAEISNFTTDGIVGVPLAIEVRRRGTPDLLSLMVSKFSCDLGTIRISHDDDGQSWMSYSGFSDYVVDY